MDKIEKLQAFLAANPTDSFLRHAMALELVKQGDDAGARALFESVLKDDPAYVGSYYHLGQLLERLSLPEEAQRWYESGMEAARRSGDRHAFGELQGALDLL